MLSDTTTQRLKENLRGELIQRSDERYEEARKRACSGIGRATS